MKKNVYRWKSFPWSSHTTIAALLESERADSILDVGSGAGFLGLSLSYAPRELCAVDREVPALPKNYTASWTADLDETDFSFLSDKRFRTIVLADVLEHLKDPRRVVLRLKKYAEPDGHFIFSFPNMECFAVQPFVFLGMKPKMKRGPFDATHLHDFTFESAQKIFKESGLEVIETRSTPLPLPLFFKIFGEEGSFFFIYRMMHRLAQKFPRHFAYQYIVRAKIL